MKGEMDEAWGGEFRGLSSTLTAFKVMKMKAEAKAIWSFSHLSKSITTPSSASQTC